MNERKKVGERERERERERKKERENEKCIEEMRRGKENE